LSTTDGQPQSGQAFPPQTYGIPQQSQPPANPYGDVPPSSPPAGGLPDPAPAPKSGGMKARGIASVIVLVVIGAVLFAINWFTSRDDITNASVGDCATYEEGAEEPYTKADCNDAAATFVVLKVVDGDEECKDVPGAERSISKDGGSEICFGIKGVDPNTSINVAQEGDCLAVVGNDAVRTECTSAEATHEVLRRLTDVSTAATDPCEDLEAYTDSYSWSWVSDTGPDLSGLRSDVLLCLSQL
jgi:hypothetical protein